MAMYPGTAKFQTRPASPQFGSFTTPGDYPHGLPMQPTTQTASAAVHNMPSNVGNMNMMSGGSAHHGSMSVRHQKTSTQGGIGGGVGVGSSATGGIVKTQRNAAALIGGGGGGSSGGQHHMMGMSGAATMGHHRGDLIFPDDMDSIEFCMPPPPAPSNGIGHGVNGELLLMHGTGGPNGICEAFTERRRRGHSRRSNHKMDVEQQVKWSRKNIAATMERFEPNAGASNMGAGAAPHSSSSTSSLEYGFAAGVVTPTSSTPSHHGVGGGGHSPAPPSTYGFNGGGGVGGSGGATASAPFNHVYSYAYYEPGAAKCHTNIPHKDGLAAGGMPSSMITAGAVAGPSKSPPRNSIRALLAKSFRSKSSSNSGQSTSSSPSTDDRHTYTTRYGTTENLYEEVNEQKIRKVLSDNRIATSNVGNVKEELRRVQHNHFRVLDELNLSLEALIMPPTPPDISPNHGPDDEEDGPSTSAAAQAQAAAVAAAQVAHPSTAVQAAATSVTHSQRGPRRGGLLGGAASSSSSTTSSQQRTLSHASLENLSTTLNSMELKDHAHNSCINPEFDEGDLDSGFSGSGSSSGASYNESLRYYKTGTNHQHHQHHHQQHHQQQQQQQQQHLNHNNIHMQTTTLPHNLRSCRSSTASGTSTSKSSMASCEDQGIAGMGSMMGMSQAMGMGMMGGAGGVACGSIQTAASPFNFARRCSDTQRASGRSISASAASASSTATGTKPKKNFWTIKP